MRKDWPLCFHLAYLWRCFTKKVIYKFLIKWYHKQKDADNNYNDTY